jgi:protein-S-isoprenylcysteine O-methyltransferase Ste14
MCVLFYICFGALAPVVVCHFLSVEHARLEKKFGNTRGVKIGNALGMISGWGFFIALIGAWFVPQPGFVISMLESGSIEIPLLANSINIVHVIISIPFMLASCYLGIMGVKDVSLRVAETHRAEKIVKSGIYARVRHPQYLAAVLAHVGMSFFCSALLSLLFTPAVVFVVYIISWKEEKELLSEFGAEYRVYKDEVPMFLPRLRRSQVSVV